MRCLRLTLRLLLYVPLSIFATLTVFLWWAVNVSLAEKIDD
jgi:hypothetical protein